LCFSLLIGVRSLWTFVQELEYHWNITRMEENRHE
jgi:hypothetical protein